MKTLFEWIAYAENRPGDINFIVSHKDYFIDDENTEFFFMDFLYCIHLLKLDILNFMVKGYTDDEIITYIRRNITDAEMLYNWRVLGYFMERGKTNE